MANLLDTAVKLPIIPIRVGLDSLIGLIPGAGDALMLGASLRIIWLAKRMGVPKPLLTKMVKNSAIDFGLGFIPLVGDIVDVFYKANQKNVRILEKWWVTENKASVDSATQAKLQQWESRLEEAEKEQR
ncbi:DUF4112 domain-containing protein [Alteromonas sp. H39]|uniref:DUF4112 domain-containing protein n=1 Tax=Alteromonas sp. H39 TaxID=3389876 RepID=UPI0039E0EC9A